MDDQTAADAAKNDDVLDNTKKEKDVVDRVELQKVISQRDELKQKYKSLQSEIEQIKNDFESKKVEDFKKLGNVEELEKSFNSVIAAERGKFESISKEVDIWKSKYTDLVVNDKVKTIANDVLSDAGTELFLQLFKPKIQLSDDNNIKIKDDVRSINEIVLEFSEKYNLKKNPVKTGMSTQNINNGFNITKAQFEQLSPVERSKLPTSILNDYLQNKLK
jgi:hypothetical protein